MTSLEAAWLYWKRAGLESEYLGTVFSSFADVLCVLGKVAFLLWALVIHLYN